MHLPDPLHDPMHPTDAISAPELSVPQCRCMLLMERFGGKQRPYRCRTCPQRQPDFAAPPVVGGKGEAR